MYPRRYENLSNTDKAVIFMAFLENLHDEYVIRCTAHNASHGQYKQVIVGTFDNLLSSVPIF